MSAKQSTTQRERSQSALPKEVQDMAWMAATDVVAFKQQISRPEAFEQAKQRGLRFIWKASNQCVICPRPIVTIGAWERGDGGRVLIYGVCKRHQRPNITLLEGYLNKQEREIYGDESPTASEVLHD